SKLAGFHQVVPQKANRSLTPSIDPPIVVLARMFNYENENLPQSSYFNKILFHNELGRAAWPIRDATPASLGFRDVKPASDGSHDQDNGWDVATRLFMKRADF
ncbi:MAG TPA: hypothetical protein P5307_18335, partial [Pirellulaceae bacterium]|nr:hypothetical protein [Pirellulaceae bacterium]